MNGWPQILSMNPAQRDHLPAGRIALGVAVPLLLLLTLGQLHLAIFATFAAFTGIYARHEPLRSRTLHQTCAALMLLLCEALGLWLSHAQASAGLVVCIEALVAGLTAMLAAVLRLRPAGALFFVFTVTAIAGVPPSVSATQGMLVAVATALFCLALGVMGALVSQRIRPTELSAPPPASLSRSELLWHGLRHFIAALLGGSLGLLSHFGHSYWATVAAVAPLSGVNQPARISRAIQRVVGTLGGIGVTVFLLAFTPSTWAIALLVIGLQFLAEMFVARNYSLALLFVTPLALLMTQLAGHSDPWTLVTARTVETVIGAVAGLLVVLVLRSPVEKRQDEARTATADDENIDAHGPDESSTGKNMTGDN